MSMQVVGVRGNNILATQLLSNLLQGLHNKLEAEDILMIGCEYLLHFGHACIRHRARQTVCRKQAATERKKASGGGIALCRTSKTPANGTGG